MHFYNFVCFKSSIEDASWPWSPFKYSVGSTKDDAGVQNADGGHPQEEFLNAGLRYLNGPGNSGRLWDAYLGRQVPARGTGPYVLNESCQRLPGGCAQWYFLKWACPRLPWSEDVPATYFVGVRDSERRQSLGRLAGGRQPSGTQGGESEKGIRITVFWWS